MWSALWLIWLGIFLVIEVAALVRKAQGDTLSEHIWKWCSIREKGKWWRLRRLALVVLLAWLVLHMLTGGQF